MHEPFEIRSLGGEVLKTVGAPASGWTHPELEKVAAESSDVTHEGADGYLGGVWVGSTET
jgi:hypothetical protein